MPRLTAALLFRTYAFKNKKMRFDIITIFPNLFDSFLNESLIESAQKKKLINIKVHDLRRWSKDRHKSVDDRPFGGGLGMVMKVEPIYKAVKKIAASAKSTASRRNTKVVLFSPRGKKFSQKIATQLSKMDQVIFICGRYEGVDERVSKKIADMEISVGDFVLMGGEIPAMAVIETVSRLVPGVIGKEEFLKERKQKNGGFVEYPQYTRPEIFEADGKKWKVPKFLLSGRHKEIEDWRKANGKILE